MKGKREIIFSVLTIFLIVSVVAFAQDSTIVIDKQVKSSSDDAYHQPACCWPGYSHSAGNIYAGTVFSEAVPVYGGWRFTDVNIPANAIITKAYVELNQQAWGYVVPTKLSLQDSKSPQTFSKQSSPYTRWTSRTNFEIEWTWGKKTPNSWIKTPSLVDGVQELVNTHGSITSIVLLEAGKEGTNGDHSWVAFDNSAAYAAKLHIEYTIPDEETVVAPPEEQEPATQEPVEEVPQEPTTQEPEPSQEVDPVQEPTTAPVIGEPTEELPIVEDPIIEEPIQEPVIEEPQNPQEPILEITDPEPEEPAIEGTKGSKEQPPELQEPVPQEPVVEEIYQEPVPQEQNHVEEACTFFFADWSVDEADNGDLVSLLVEGRNCEHNNQVNIEIYEESVLFSDNLVYSNSNIAFSEDLISFTWQVFRDSDGFFGLFSPKYYFVVTILETNEQIKSGILTVSTQESVQNLEQQSLESQAINSQDVNLEEGGSIEAQANPSTWPLKVDLAVGESYVYNLPDGTSRTMTLVSRNVVSRQHHVTATVSVSGNGKTETATIVSSHGAKPITLNGLKIYAYSWKEADDTGFEQVDCASLGLASGKDHGFAVQAASREFFTELDNYAYPLENAFHEGPMLQTWLEPFEGEGSAAHSGYDIGVWANVRVLAIMDGYAHFQYYGDQGQLWMTETSNQWGTIRRRMTHINSNSALVPSGSFVTAGTPIAASVYESGGVYYDHYHYGSCTSTSRTDDFGGWFFLQEIWNNEHQTDFPTPQHWLVAGPFSSTNLETPVIASDESGNIATNIQPRIGGDAGTKTWLFRNNLVNSVTRLGDLISVYPWSGNTDREPSNSFAYATTYVYSPTQTNAYLHWGVSYGGKVWLNGQQLYDNTESRYNTYNTQTESPIEIDKYEYPITLNPGWNTLIIKTNHGSRQRTAWLFSSKIGDANGNKIDALQFSTRTINLNLNSWSSGNAQVSWVHPNDPNTYVQTYLIDVATDAGFTNLVSGYNGKDVGRVTSTTINGLNANTKYYIRVRPYSYDDLGGSTYWQHMDMVTTDGDEVPPPQDTIAPTTAILCNGSACSGTFQSDVSTTLSCNDAGGCEVTYYCQDTSNSCTPNIAYTEPITVSGVGNHYVRYYSIDISENTESVKSQQIIVEETPEPIYLAVPGRIEAEDYKQGGEGIGYHDTSSGNSGDANIRNDDVDIEITGDSSGSYNIGYTISGEWLAYDVNIAQAGTYTVTARVASAGTETKTLHLEVDGNNVSGPISFEPTGGWQTYTNVQKTITLPAGQHELKIVFDTDSTNLNYINFAAGEQSSDALRVLFIGNSLTAYNGHTGKHVAAIAQERGKQFEWDRVHLGGTTLQGHWDNGAAQAKINEGGWDIVVLQGWWWGGSNVATFKQNVRDYDSLIKAQGGQTWLFEAYPSGNCADPNEFCYLGDGIRQEIITTNSEIAAEVGATVVPVLQAWITNYQTGPDYQLYSSDSVHPELLGTYLNSLMFYEKLFNDNVQGVNYVVPTSDTDSPAQAIAITSTQKTALQNLAHQTITGSTAPVTSVMCNGANCQLTAYTGTVSVTLSCQDSSGCSQTQYCVDTTNTCDPTTIGTSATISNQGTNYIRFRSTDNNGNIESVKSRAITIASSQQGPIPLPSTTPPGGLAVSQTPIFVVFGSDDNNPSNSGGSTDNGVKFLADTMKGRTNPDGSNWRMSFYIMGDYSFSPTWASELFQQIARDGNEIGNHQEGAQILSAYNDWLNTWTSADNSIRQMLVAAGLNPDDDRSFNRRGVRTHQDQMSDNAIQAAKDLGYLYHSSHTTGHPTTNGGIAWFPGSMEVEWPGAAFWDNRNYNPIDGMMQVPQHYYGDSSAYCDTEHIPSTPTAQDSDEFANDAIASIQRSIDNNHAPVHFCLHDWKYPPTRQTNRDAIIKIADWIEQQQAAGVPIYVVTNGEVYDWMRNPVPVGEQSSDNQPPVTTISCNGSTCLPSYPNSVSVSLSCIDASGCESVRYCVDTTNSCTPTTIGTSISLSVEGTNFVRYRAVDNAGNIESVRSQQIEITIPETTPPETTAQCNGATCSGSYTGSVTIDLSCLDESGCSQTQYCVDSVDNCNPTSIGTTTSVSNQGTNYVRYRSTDSNGNVEPVKSVTVSIVLPETNPPVTSIQCAGTTCQSQYEGSVNIGFACNDDSGCKKTEFCVDTTNSCTPNTVGSLVLDDVGTNYVRYRSIDTQDNIENIKSQQIEITPRQIAENVFIEDFVFEGNHASIIKGGTATTVWWDEDKWDIRAALSPNTLLQGTSPNGFPVDGHHIDIHHSVPDVSSAEQDNIYAINGNGGPGIGVMHVDYEDILSARIRNPLVISDSQPAVIEFRATTFVNTGHWWEIAITPANGPVIPGDLTSAPDTSNTFVNNPGPGNWPAEDSLNFITIGRNDVDCPENNGEPWRFINGIQQTIGGVETYEQEASPIITTPEDANELYKWRIEYWPNKVEVFVDLDEDGVLEPHYTFDVSIPWNEIYVNLQAYAYQADHHPQAAVCNEIAGHTVREFGWKEVRAWPTKYERTASFPKNDGTDQIIFSSGWTEYDTRDTQRTGEVNGIKQANAGEFHKHLTDLFCNGAFYGCNSESVSSKTLSIDLPAEAVQGIARAQLLYEVKQPGTAQLRSINGVNVNIELPGQRSVRYNFDQNADMWVERSVEFDASLLQSGTNTFVIDLQPNIAFDRLQLDFAYGEGSNQEDVFPPTTSIQCNGNTCLSSYSQAVSISLSCSDVSGCSQTQYCVDTTNNCNPTTTGNSVSVSASGQNYVRYRSTDNNGNIENIKSQQINIASDTVPPVITSTSSTPSTTTAIITWTTDELSTSQVQYGTSSSLGQVSTEDTQLKTEHSVILTNLQTESQYFYRPVSKDTSDNVALGSLNSFETQPQLGQTDFTVTVNANNVVEDFTAKNRGFATSNWDYLWHGLGVTGGSNTQAKVDTVHAVAATLNPGIIRFAGGLWANRVGWDPTGIAPTDGAWTDTVFDGGSYTHAYKPAMVDDFADLLAATGAEALVQINACDNNLAMWQDFVQYSLDKGYNFEYYEFGNEQSLENNWQCLGAATEDEAGPIFAQRYMDYRQALQAIDPNLKLMASPIHQPYMYNFDNWLDNTYNVAGDNLDAMAMHWYQLSESMLGGPSSSSYNGGSVDALFAYDGNVGTNCNSYYGCTLANPDGGITQFNAWIARRGIVEKSMEQLKTRYTDASPGIETAVTEIGPHASFHTNAINSNQAAAIWLADIMGRFAYNGLDIMTFYTFEDGGNGQSEANNDGNSRGYFGIWDSQGDFRPIYYTALLYSQYFGDNMVEVLVDDPDKLLTAWVATDSNDPGKIKFIISNFYGEAKTATLDVTGMNVASGLAWEVTGKDPYDIADHTAFTDDTTNINGIHLDDVTWGDTITFQNQLDQIRNSGKPVQVADNKATYLVPAHSVVAITLSGDSVEDTFAPQTSILCNLGSCSKSFIETVSVTLSCQDSSGCLQTQYCVDTTNTCNPTTIGTSFNINNIGQNYVRYRSTDSKGNVESVKSQQIIVEEAPEPIYLAVPGRVEAEDYKQGGEGIGYHDTSSGNSGDANIRNDDVDIEITGDSSGSYNIGYTISGEWLAYDVNIAQAGTYTVTARVASAGTGTKTLHLEVDGNDVSGPISFEPTGGWQTYTNVQKTITLPAGQHELKIVFDTDSTNLNYITFAAEVTVPDTQAPSTAILCNGVTCQTTYTNSVNIDFECADNVACSQTQYCVDTTNSCNPTTIGSSTTISTLGSHFIRYRSIDTSGNTESVKSRGISIITDDTTLPTVSITTPSQGQTLKDMVTIAATANDANGIEKVEFRIDNSQVLVDTTSPYQYSWDTTSYSDASHTIQVIATDNNGLTNSDSITVNVNNAPAANNPPVVDFIDPADGATVSGSIHLQATATDDNGINHVNFYVDDTFIKRENLDPYEATLDTTLLANGEHTLSATAYEISPDTQQTTDEITIIVQNNIPQAPIISNLQYTLTIDDTNAPVYTVDAEFTWNTDRPATSLIEYGETNQLGQSSGIDVELKTTHSIGVTGLDPNKEYYFQAVSSDSEGLQGRSLMNSLTTPQAPCYLTDAQWSVSEAVEGDSVTLTIQGLNCNGDEISFDVYEDDLAGDDTSVSKPENAIFVNGVASTNWRAEYAQDALGSDPEYYFIGSLIDNSDSIQSGLLTVTSSILEDTTPPSTPQNLQAEIQYNNVSLTWQGATDAESGIDKYVVYRNNAVYATVSSTRYDDLGVEPETAYEYVIAAINGAGLEGSQSQPRIVNVPRAPDTTPPSAPSLLSYEVVGSSKINLEWSPGEDEESGVHGYEIIRDGKFHDSTQNTYYNDTAVSPATTYNYQVLTVNRDGLRSAKTPFVEATTESIGDTTAPADTKHNPQIGSVTQENSLVSLHVEDSGSGVDYNSIELTVNGQDVSEQVSGDPSDYLVAYYQKPKFGAGSTINVQIRAQDFAGNILDDSYQYTVDDDAKGPKRGRGKTKQISTTTTEDTIIALSTDEVSTCRYAEEPGLVYDEMTQVMVSGSEPVCDISLGDFGCAYEHTANVGDGFEPETELYYYAKCEDEAGNINSDDFPINFTVCENCQRVVGEKTEVENNLLNMDLKINGSRDIQTYYGEVVPIEFYETVGPKQIRRVKFDFAFDQEKVLRLNDIKINKQTSDARASIIISGIGEIVSKEIMMDRLRDDDRICIKDAEITSLSQISEGCDGANEYILTCDGQLNQGYRCSLQDGYYHISGLRHSAVIEYIEPEPVTPNPPPPSNSGGGSSGSSSGGGGGGALDSQNLELIDNKEEKPIENKIPEVESDPEVSITDDFEIEIFTTNIVEAGDVYRATVQVISKATGAFELNVNGQKRNVELSQDIPKEFEFELVAPEAQGSFTIKAEIGNSIKTRTVDIEYRPLFMYIDEIVDGNELIIRVVIKNYDPEVNTELRIVKDSGIGILVDEIQGATEYTRQFRLSKPGEYTFVALATNDGVLVDTDDYTLVIPEADGTGGTTLVVALIILVLVLGAVTIGKRLPIQKYLK